MMKQLLVLAFCFALASCKSEPSLQKYFVEKTEENNFIAVDVSPTMFNIDKSKLTAEEFQAMETLDKINILAFPLTDSTRAQYDTERAKVDEILQDKKYQELMHFGSGKNGASVSFVGDENHIDEFVLFAKSDESGFAVVRILGKDMNPTAIVTMMSVLKESNMNLDQLKPLQDMFNKNL